MLLTCGNVEVLKIMGCGISDSSVEAPTRKRASSMWDCEGNEIKACTGTRMPKILDLAVTPDEEIRILNVTTNAERVISEKHSITSLSVSGDSKFLIVYLSSQEIHMWDVDGKWVKPLKYTGHKQEKYVSRSCFGGLNSTFIASGQREFTGVSKIPPPQPAWFHLSDSVLQKVYIWNRRSPNPIEVLSGHKMTVNCVSWNHKKPQMFASASDMMIKPSVYGDQALLRRRCERKGNGNASPMMRYLAPKLHSFQRISGVSSEILRRPGEALRALSTRGGDWILRRPGEALTALSTRGGDWILRRPGEALRALSTRGGDWGIPGAFDWRVDRGIVTRVKDQGSLDACYAYAATTAVEYIHQIRKKEFVQVSVKEILDVGVGSGDDGEGGKSFQVLDWIADNGISREPMDDGQVGDIVTIDNVECFGLKSDLQLQKAILECGPVVVEFSTTDYFCENEGDIYFTTEKSLPGHDLVFTGWGTSADGIHYWNAQNSWGLEFGDAGFVRIMRMGRLWWGPERSLVRACVPVIH
ncbi:hypothetical protein RHSIM_Rhsim01G0204000 [Rhododendron simsii]|uniref:Peptidase C1A papain C-terminal domain-containing protein n=1 Tax=Rhododendron simsii TaxID=118357 RepID=A0A834HGV5_RHOSS|nr:hypothetical protein RHSIM_Rhsim01G0204000 [Rhododendron simsii]